VPQRRCATWAIARRACSRVPLMLQ